MRRLALLALLVAAPARAQAEDDAPFVDVEDLPPLPDPTELADASDVAVAAASAVEEDVVVGAAKREQSLGNVASAVTVISGDKLRRFGYRTVAEALRGVAGVHVIDDHMTERVGIRGLQVLGDFNSRVLVLVDGATVNETWGQFAGVGTDAPVSIDDVARIEVIRGPVSSLYGTNAFFGIINIVTRGADQSPKLWGRMSGSSQLGGGLAAGFADGTVDQQLRGSVSVTQRGGEALSVDEIGDMSKGVDAATAVNASVVGVWHGAFAQVRFFHRKRKLPFAPYETIVDDDRNANTDTQVMVEGGYNRAINDRVTLTGRVYASRYRFTDRLAYEPEIEGDPDDVFRDFGDALWAGAELRGRWDVLDNNRLGVTAGGETTFIDTQSLSYYEGGDAADTVEVPKRFSIQGVYAEVDGAPTSWFGFTGGLRFDNNTALDRRLSPRAALFFSKKDKAGLKLLYAEGFRNPSPYEGFFEDGIDFIANPDIGSETIRSYEVVLWGRPIGGVSARLSGFRWEADKIVEQDLDPDGSGLLQFQNLGALTSTGAELEASYRDAKGWLAFGGLSAQLVRGGADDKVAGAPAFSGSAGVSTPLFKKLAHVSTEVQVMGPRPTREPGVTTDPFVGWNLAVYFPDVNQFDVTIAARNLIGTREQVPAQEDYDRDVRTPDLPGEGRELHARVGYRF